MVTAVVLRASLPPHMLHARFLEAMGDEEDVDLLVEGRRAALLPHLVRRLRLGGREGSWAALVGMAIFPQVFLVLLQAKRLGRIYRCRRVHGAREVVVEIRLPQTVV